MHGLAGALTGLACGVVMSLLAIPGGQLRSVLPAVLVFTALVVAAGVLFERVVGGLGPGVLFWCAAFPVARLAQEAAVAASGGQTALASQGVPAFVLWQLLVGGAFGLGFVLLHRQIARLVAPKEAA